MLKRRFVCPDCLSVYPAADYPDKFFLKRRRREKPAVPFQVGQKVERTDVQGAFVVTALHPEAGAADIVASGFEEDPPTRVRFWEVEQATE